MSGEIPPELGSLANLEDLYLSGNQLWRGCIPTSLQDQSVSVSGSPFCASVPETDREALVALYNATDGPNWANNENWLSDAPIGEWYGVRTDDNGRVTWLWLYGNRLSGETPSELSSLSNLNQLRLNNNELSGEIPPELGRLSNLESLVLSDNELRGCLPSSLQDRLTMEVSDLGGLPFYEAVPVSTTTPMSTAPFSETDRVALGLASKTIGRVRPYTPIVKSAVAYPLQSRYRTGLSHWRCPRS